MYRLTTIFIVTFFLNSLWSANLDSIQASMRHLPNDSNKIKKMFNHLILVDIEQKSFIKFANELKLQSAQIKWPYGIAYANERIGRVYWGKGQYDSARHYHFTALQQFKALKNQEKFWHIVVMLGQDYANDAQYEKSLVILNLAKTNYLAIKDIDAVNYVNGILAWTYSSQGDNVSAIKLTLEEIKFKEKNKDSVDLIYSYLCLISNYFALKNYEKVEDLLNLSKKICSQKNFSRFELEFSAYAADLFSRKNQYDSAMFYYNQEIHIAKTATNPPWIGDGFFNIGKIYSKLNNLKLAQFYLDSAYYYFKIGNQLNELTKVQCFRTICFIKNGELVRAKTTMNDATKLINKFDNEKTKLDYYQAKYLYDSATGQWQSTLVNYRLYEGLRDKLYNSEKEKEIFELQYEYEVEKRERALKENNHFYYTILILCALLGLGFIVFYIQLYRKNEKITKQSQIQVVMLNEIHHRVKNNLQLIISYMHLHLSKTKDITARNAIENSMKDIEVISLVHENLYKHSSDTVELRTYIPMICHNLTSITEKEKQFEIKLQCDDIFLSIDKTIPLGLIINELITNTKKHAFSKNQIEKNIVISCNIKNERILFSYQDNGKGFEVDQVEQKSIGLKLIQMLVEELQGNYTINGKDGFCLELKFKNKNGSKK